MTADERLNEAHEKIMKLCRDLEVSLESNGHSVYIVHSSFVHDDCVLKTVREINTVPF